MGDGTAVAHWTALWAADDCPQCRSGAIRGNVRWTAAVITMDGSGVIAIVGGSSDGQRRQRNERQDSGAIVIGNEMRGCKTIAANAEAAQREFGILDLCFFWLRSQLGKLPPEEIGP
jgi:hypothetical protein